MRYLVLSVDYEIFGNGAGDVRQHVVEPTEQMANHCNRYGIPLTVFFEVEEYLAFEKYSKPLTQDLGYDPAQLIQNQVVALAQQGHDFQLHLHPEWYGARYQDGNWLLHRDKCTVDGMFESQEEATQYIRDRKSVIEELIGSGRLGRKVLAYRAGAFSAQPGRKLLPALAKNGFCIESSVVKGLYRNWEHVTLDYRQAPEERLLWPVSTDVGVEDPRGTILEIPVYSKMGRRIHQATWSRLKAKFSRNVPKQQQQNMVRQLGIRSGPFQVLKFLCQPVPIKLDFHNLSPRTLVRWIKTAPKPGPQDPLDVLVLIGHTKEHINNDHFRKFLDLLSRESSLKVLSFSDLAHELTSKKNAFAPSSL